MKICKEPNKSKISIFSADTLTSSGAKADIASLYIPSDIIVEHVEHEQNYNTIGF